MPQDLLNRIAVQCTLMSATLNALGEHLTELDAMSNSPAREFEALTSKCTQMGQDFQALGQREITSSSSALASRILDQAEELLLQPQAINARIDAALKRPDRHQQQLAAKRDARAERRAQTPAWRKRTPDGRAAQGERRRQSTDARVQETVRQQADEIVKQARGLLQSVTGWCEQGKTLLQQVQREK